MSERQSKLITLEQLNQMLKGAPVPEPVVETREEEPPGFKEALDRMDEEGRWVFTDEECREQEEEYLKKLRRSER